MNNYMRILQQCILSILLFGFFSCEDPPIECADVMAIEGSTAQINGDQALLERLDFLPSSGGGSEFYEYIITAVMDDCDVDHRFRFYVTFPEGAGVEGTYPVLASNIFTEGRLTSGTYGMENAEISLYDIRNAVDGQAIIERVPGAGYRIELQFSFDEGADVELVAQW